ncbi:ubiquinone/menaquinone biosynthesis C-methylase UbiE [Methanolinea mesophila]|uniref:class I SAM-dependent methyltransferase n=1 Tax=Methanolinea mesophila TaxID=547055 RepID=UPI001AE83B0E|nr:ubiquinone/menaquinone biosynthesis C-methylase UbiE [Methanolinea mesophila]
MKAVSKVQRHYDEVAHIYDRRYDRSGGRAYYSHISRHVMEGLPGDKRLLDLGCGTGLFLSRYRSTGGDGVGLDISRMMLNRAQERSPSSSLCMGNAEHLPFRDGSFDVVASLLAFSYLRNPDRVLEESFRILSPGGTIAICTLGKNLFTTGLPAVYQIGEVMGVTHVGMGNFGERYYSGNEMGSLLREAGFRQITVKRISFAHVSLARPLFHLAKKFEPFVETHIPYLAYNLVAFARKPE